MHGYILEKERIDLNRNQITIEFFVLFLFLNSNQSNQFEFKLKKNVPILYTSELSSRIFVAFKARCGMEWSRSVQALREE